MMEIEKNVLYINGEPIGNEQVILDICDKANTLDEVRANYKPRTIFKQSGDSQ